MAITREEVQHVARLARLSLQEAEAERLREQLSAILDYVRQLDRLDTRDVVPTSHAIETGTPFRDDVVEPFGDKEALLANAPDRLNDFFRVPRIIGRIGDRKGDVRALNTPAVGRAGADAGRGHRSGDLAGLVIVGEAGHGNQDLRHSVSQAG